MSIVVRSFGQVKRFCQNRYGLVPLEQSQAAFERWLQSGRGQKLLAAERAMLEQQMECVFGFYLLQLSMSPSIDVCHFSTVNHHFQSVPTGGVESGISHCISNFEQLPYASESIDVVVLHHVLEYVENPHQLLREAQRVLIPNGHLLIVGFNPLSFYGLQTLWMKFFSKAKRWRLRSLALARVVDWLNLLDVEPISISRGYEGLSIRQALNKMRSISGGAYSVLARKRVIPLTPIKSYWKKSPISWGEKQPFPTASQSHEKS